MGPDLVGGGLPIGCVALALVAQMIDAFRALQVGAVGTGLVNHLAHALYKVTLFRRAGVHRKLKPETYLLQREADGNLYLNTGFRIDVAYNEETDILSFSPNGDYIRVNTDETANGEKKKEQ